LDDGGMQHRYGLIYMEWAFHQPSMGRDKIGRVTKNFQRVDIHLGIPFMHLHVKLVLYPARTSICIPHGASSKIKLVNFESFLKKLVAFLSLVEIR